jgi:hypothetical protein
MKREFILSSITFFRHFNKYCNYGFRVLKVDLCDFCLKYQKTENKTQKINHEHENYLISVQEYRNFKNSLIINSENICIEFDYSANKVLPKINNSERYYKRALYLYLTNFHIHRKNMSFIFNALEGESKKGANSVILSLLCH